MTLFVISDIHGEYDVMLNDLASAGYNENNPEHKLIVLGDSFDRGGESFEIYTYLKRLTDEDKAIVLRGNHTKFLIDFLEGKDFLFNYKYNGLNETIDSFMHETRALETFLIFNEDEENPVTYKDFQKMAIKTIKKENPKILEWLKERPYYYETENYIFTHASIDTECSNWKEPQKTLPWCKTSWEACTWDDGSFFGKEIKNTDKKIVVGHFYTDQIREMYGLEKEDDLNRILVRDDERIIMIDSCTPYTKRLNVLLVNDKLLK